MPHQNLPKEIEYERCRQCVTEDNNGACDREDCEGYKPDSDSYEAGYQAGKASGYKEGLLGAMEELGEEWEEEMSGTLGFVAGIIDGGKAWKETAILHNQLRSELLSRLEERLNDGVQE